MDSKKKGQELNQLSKILFDQAANNFYWSKAVNLLVGIIGIFANFYANDDLERYITAVVIFLLVMLAFWLNFQYEEDYDRAETMRRQSILTEGLGWSINQTLFRDWKSRLSKEILAKVKVPREDGYYETTERSGPKKLLEMTNESASFTKMLYIKIRAILFGLFILGALSTFFLYIIFPLNLFPDDKILQIFYILYLVLPVVVATDLFNWILRLNRLISAIREIEKDFGTVEDSRIYNENEVLRLVYEYNCQVAMGIPIHPFMFKLWQDEIDKFWKER